MGRPQEMEEVLREIASVVQSIARIEAEVIAVEAATREAKAAGDVGELAALRDKENTLLRLQGALAAALGATSPLARVFRLTRPSSAQSGASPRPPTSKCC